jgi:pimeloyl-ACP methyl ester carboxylesterase
MPLSPLGKAPQRAFSDNRLDPSLKRTDMPKRIASTPTTATPLHPQRPAPPSAATRPAAPSQAGWTPKTPYQRGAGPKVDVVNATKDWMSDRVFESQRPKVGPDKMSPAQRVAYGPLAKPPTLQRPVVMIPGLTMPAQSFDRMGNQLATNTANGPVIVYVASQDTFRLGDKGGREVTAAELKSAKLFQLEYRDPWAAPTKKAPQIARAMERIAAATGQSLDVVTHSAGGTDFRLYLDQRDPAKGPKVERAVMIGPASHGTHMGNIGAAIGHPVKNVDEAGRELAVGSKLVTSLNATWERQRGQVAGGVTIIGTTGTPTLGPKKGLFEDGDGYMPTAQLAMPGAKTVLMEGPHNTPLAHLWQVQYSGVVNAAFEVLGR